MDAISILFPSLYDWAETSKACIFYHAKIDYWLFIRSEKGTYYALDLEGPKFRVLRVQLGGQRSILEQDVKTQDIPPHLMTSTSKVSNFATHIEHFFEILWHIPFFFFFCCKLMSFLFVAGSLWFHCFIVKGICWKRRRWFWNFTDEKGTWIYILFSCEANIYIIWRFD